MRKVFGLLIPLLAGCASTEPEWVHPTLGGPQAQSARAACEARAEDAAGPPAPLPRPCGGEISTIARDACQRDADAAYARLAARIRARDASLAACLTDAGFTRR
ncbi:MAG: hypothetical protein ING29_08330 [Azospirillum sp.]|nr:hypothetical protein [Azospirillum sp.]